MSRHNKRWEPPHPAIEERPPRVTRPVHTWQDAARELVPDKLCTWTGCSAVKFGHLPICLDHALKIAEWVNNTPDRDAALVIAERIVHKRYQAERQQLHQEAIAASRGLQPGWIYYVLTDGKIKIGYTADITRRLRAYPPGSEILAVHPGTPDLEKLMHQRFGAYRVAGREWFRPDPEILDYCTQVVAEHGNPKRFAPKVRDPHDTNRVVAGKRMNRRW